MKVKDSEFTLNQWGCIKDYLACNCINYSSLVFKPSLEFSPYLNYALDHLYMSVCSDFVFKTLDNEQMKKVFVRGLPVPFILDISLSNLMLRSSNEVTTKSLSFDNGQFYSSWMNQLLNKINKGYVKKQNVFMGKELSHLHDNYYDSVCLTYQECDLLEVYCISNNISYKRMDEMSVLNDACFYKIICLYVFLTSPQNIYFLTYVIQMELNDFPSPSKLNYYTQRMLFLLHNNSHVFDLPDELKKIYEVCKLYSLGVSPQNYMLFIKMFYPLSSLALQERWLVLELYLVNSFAGAIFKSNSEQTLLIFNSLLSPEINGRSCLVSNKVDLSHISIKGKTVYRFDLYKKEEFLC